MADVKIQDVNLIATPAGTNKMPVSDDSGVAKTISVAQINGVHEAAYDHSTYLTETGADALYAPVLGADDNYMTDAEKTKLSGIADGAEVNVNADWNATSGDAQILNKPIIPSVGGLLDETAHDLLDHTGLTGIPTAYTLPTASTTVLGGVKIDGTTILISDGVISSTGGSGGGVTDHGLLTGLADDDHSQYLNETRHDLLDHSGLTGIPSITGLLDEAAHDLLDHAGLTGVPTQYTDEMAQDAIGALIANGSQTGITVSYDDANNKLDFTVVASGSGDVTGPSSATDGNIALFDGITGKVIKNSTVSPTSFATALGTDDNYVTDAEKTKLSNLSGTNTGDQDLSGYSTTTHNHSLNNLTEKSYNSLTDKPSIPSISGLLDETAHDALDHTGLTGIPAVYSLPTASTTVLGGVKVDGTTVTITDGVISSSGSCLTNPMTTAGDIIIGGTSGAPTRLAKGTDGQVLTVVAGVPTYAAASGGSSTIDWTSPVVVTDTSTLAYGKHYIVAVTTADKTLALPEITATDYGKMVVVEIAAATTKIITIDGYAAQTIDGAATRVMWSSEVAQLVATTAGWTKVGGKSIPITASVRTALATTPTIPSNTWASIPWDTVNNDRLGLWDNTNKYFSLKRDGLYFFQFAGSNQNSGAGSVSGRIQRLNNTALSISPSYLCYGPSEKYPAPFASCWYSGVTGDRIASQAYFADFSAAMWGNSGPFTITESVTW